MKILYVTGNKYEKELYELLVQNPHIYDVRFAIDALDALQQFENEYKRGQGFDLVLTEFALPNDSRCPLFVCKISRNRAIML